MAVVKDTRRANLEALIAAHGSIRELADAAGANAAHLSQIRNGFRSMGDTFARALERELGLETGWLDSPHDAAPEADLVTVPPLEGGADGGPLAGATVSRAWLDRYHTGRKVGHLRHIVVTEKQPIEPLHEGDLAVIDTGETSIGKDGLYVLRTAAGRVLRSARTLIDGAVYLTAPASGAIPEKVAAKELKRVDVLGRVIALVRLVAV
jgi:hypothetical protein